MYMCMTYWTRDRSRHVCTCCNHTLSRRSQLCFFP